MTKFISNNNINTNKAVAKINATQHDRVLAGEHDLGV